MHRINFKKNRDRVILLTIITLLSFSYVLYVSASSDDVSVTELQQDVNNKKSQIEQINRKLSQYRDKAREYASQTASLMNDIQSIENDIKLAELDVEATQIEIESQEIELRLIKEKITEKNRQLDGQRAILKEIIFELQRSGKIGFIEVLFGASDFNELFDGLSRLENINSDLTKALNTTKVTKDNLDNIKTKQENILDNLVALQGDLQNKVVKLKSQEEAKNVLVAETQASESQYRVLMSQLRQESQYVTNQLAQVQQDIQKKLSEKDSNTDSYGDPAIITSPLVSYILTASFHDPTYPFRNLWEHSGLDMAAPRGTPVKSAAPGIVAWTKTGRSYGNYAMVIHEGGLATLYAHMSGFNVKAGQYVTRGQQIGTVGSTGFSTGPHLHFEVRLNGIPVNPASYIVD